MSVHPFRLVGSGGKPIRGQIHTPDESGGLPPVVVGIHGFKGFRKWGFWPAIAEALVGAKFAFVGFDMSHNGVGESGIAFNEKELFEANTWAREEEDLATVIAALRDGRIPQGPFVDPDRIGLLGHSRGGGLAVVHATRDVSVLGTVALAPIKTILRFDAETMRQGRRAGFIPILNTRTNETMKLGAAAIAEMGKRSDLADLASSYAAHLSTPLLVVHGEADVSVPPAEGLALAAAAPKGKFVPIPGADHVLGCHHPWVGPTPAFETFMTKARMFLRGALGANG